MVCSSTLSARPVTHSTNRRWPGRVKPAERFSTNDSQIDQSCLEYIWHLPDSAESRSFSSSWHAGRCHFFIQRQDFLVNVSTHPVWGNSGKLLLNMEGAFYFLCSKRASVCRTEVGKEW